MPKLIHHLHADAATALANRSDLDDWTPLPVAEASEVQALCSDADRVVVLLDANTYDHAWEEAIRQLVESVPNCTPMMVMEDGSVDRAVACMTQSVTTHILPSSMLVSGDYLPLTLRKLTQNTPFGVEHYIAPGLEPMREVLSHTRQKYEQLEVFERFCELSGIAPRIAYAAVTVADELIMNAIYHAPVDEIGEHKYKDQPRNDTVSLEFSERVEFRYACDDTRLVLAVTDRFGTLTWPTIQQTLVRCMRGEVNPLDTPGQGAGLGLYSVFDKVSQMIFNIVPGARTEVLALLNITGSYKEMSSSPAALNVFTKPSR